MFKQHLSSNLSEPIIGMYTSVSNLQQIDPSCIETVLLFALAFACFGNDKIVHLNIFACVSRLITRRRAGR